MHDGLFYYANFVPQILLANGLSALECSGQRVKSACMGQHPICSKHFISTYCLPVYLPKWTFKLSATWPARDIHSGWATQ